MSTSVEDPSPSQFPTIFRKPFIIPIAPPEDDLLALVLSACFSLFIELLLALVLTTGKGRSSLGVMGERETEGEALFDGEPGWKVDERKSDFPSSRRA